MEFKEVHSDDRRTIYSNTDLLGGKEVSIIKLKQGKAIGGCMHTQNEFYLILSGLVKVTNGEDLSIETDGSSGEFNPNVPHAFFALRDSIILEWGITPEDKVDSPKDQIYYHLLGDTMKKIYLPYKTSLNEDLLKEHFEFVYSTKEADFVIAQSTLAQDFDGNFSKVIYIAVEPPLADHRLFCYSHFDKFKLVVTHNPDKEKENQISFTEDNCPQYFPVVPTSSILPFINRDTTIKNRGVFYAGMIGQYENVGNHYGGINLTVVRRKLGEHFSKDKVSKIIGIGWENQKTKVNDWRLDKQEQIKNADCDFLLALENTMLPNYLYEKIWDGFIADRVTLYLGDPNIEEHIPLDCFIDLRPFFNKETGEIDIKSIQEKIDNITQEEYDKIIYNAREYRTTAKGKHKIYKDKLTMKIIGYLND